MSSADPLEVWGVLSDLVLRTTRDLGQLVHERFDLPLKAVHVLLQLQDGALRVTELADDVHLSTSGASRAGDLLHRRGLVERLPAADDGRAITLLLTAAGRDVAQAAGQVLSDELRRVLRDRRTAELLRTVRTLA